LIVKTATKATKKIPLSDEQHVQQQYAPSIETIQSMQASTTDEHELGQVSMPTATIKVHNVVSLNTRK
jgi:hypothetical protein